jgi:hypothetical protein
LAAAIARVQRFEGRTKRLVKPGPIRLVLIQSRLVSEERCDGLSYGPPGSERFNPVGFVDQSTRSRRIETALTSLISSHF